MMAQQQFRKFQQKIQHIKVLHVLDMGGIGSMLSYYLNSTPNIKSTILVHKKHNFTDDITGFYGARQFNRFFILLIRGFFMAFSYDIIHIHSAEILVPLFKLTGKYVVLHYHGSDINTPERSNSKLRIFCRSCADFILYNDPEMYSKLKIWKPLTILEYQSNFSYFEDIVDTNHFKNTCDTKKGNLSIVSNNLDIEKTTEKIKQFGEVEIMNISKTPISYKDMPLILSKYETYVDIKITTFGLLLTALSTTALQALACGCSVFHNGILIKELPEDVRPESIIPRLARYYEGFMDR